MSVNKDTKRGDYLVRVSYKHDDGSYGQISKRVKKYSDTGKALLELKEKASSGLSDIRSATLYNASEKYLSSLSETRRAATVYKVKKYFRLFVYPYAGKITIEGFTMEKAREWKAKLSGTVSGKTGKPFALDYRQAVYSAFCGLFRFIAREYGYFNNSLKNVGGFSKDPNALPEEKEIRYWTVDEFREFSEEYRKRLEGLSPAKPEYFLRWSAFTELTALFFTGMRKGEANALLVSDFHDSGSPYLSITKSVSLKLKRETGTSCFVTPPKNKTSVRDIPIPDYLAKVIREHIRERLKRIEGYSESFFLFGGLRPVSDTTLENEKDIVEKKAGLKHIRVHDLRHSYASMLVNSGIPIEVISRLMGHASVEVTWKVYSHLYPKTSNEAIDLINRTVKANSSPILHQAKKKAL